MARYIDVDKFIEWLDIGHLRSPSEICMSELHVKKAIELQPAVDVKEVAGLTPHQIVEMQNQLAEAKLPCVWCKGDWAENFSVIDEDFGQRLTYRHIKYCPMCGRKLKQATDINAGNIKGME